MNWLNIQRVCLANSPENSFSPSLRHRRGSGATEAPLMPYAVLVCSKQPHTNEYTFITGVARGSNFSADHETIEWNWIVLRLEFYTRTSEQFEHKTQKQKIYQWNNYSQSLDYNQNGINFPTVLSFLTGDWYFCNISTIVFKVSHRTGLLFSIYEETVKIELLLLA